MVSSVVSIVTTQLRNKSLWIYERGGVEWNCNFVWYFFISALRLRECSIKHSDLNWIELNWTRIRSWMKKKLTDYERLPGNSCTLYEVVLMRFDDISVFISQAKSTRSCLGRKWSYLFYWKFKRNDQNSAFLLMIETMKIFVLNISMYFLTMESALKRR